jgi:hypothetical protein
MTERLFGQLQSRANRRGLALASETRLLRSLRTNHATLEAALSALEAEGRIHLLSTLPYVVLKLISWSGSSAPDVRKEQQISSDAAIVHMEVPVSSSRAAAATHTEDGGAGEGELLGEVLAALGPEANREEFRQLLPRYSAALVRRCLRRVQATTHIRVSRAALFRALLQRLSH